VGNKNSEKQTLKVRWKRTLYLTAFGILVAVLILDLFLAWIYAGTLTEPGCPWEAFPLAEYPVPEEHFLNTHDGLTLQYWYYPSKNGAGVIALGGQGGSLGEALPPVAFLLTRGYGVLQIQGRTCADPPAPVTLGYDEAEDAASGLEFLLSRPEIDPERIGVFGFSMGGVAAIRAAARNPDITAVVAEGGFFNLGDDFIEAGRPQSPFDRVFLYSVAGAFWLRTGVNPWQNSPIDDLPKISPRPVLLIYGENEVESGRTYAQYNAAQEPKELWIVPGGSHGSNHIVAPIEYQQRVLAFFDEHLVQGNIK
jgi:dipeptidyl aminopeptidase/acylaminoacyl peptidase